MPKTYECPWCEKEIVLDLKFDDDGGECPYCGKEYLIDAEYVEDSDFIFTLEKTHDGPSDITNVYFS